VCSTVALDITKNNEIAIENSKIGKVTAVVEILKVFGDNICNSRSANPGKLLNKSNKWLNLKKKHLKGLYEPNNNASKRLLVKQKTIRVLLDTGSSGDLLIIEKRVSKVHTYHKEGGSTIVGHFKWHLSNKKGGCY
jgi:hypothetical protein